MSTATPRLSDLCTAAEAAELLGVTRQRVSYLRRAGVLPAWRIGETWLLLRSAVQERRKNPPPAGRPPSRSS